MASTSVSQDESIKSVEPKIREFWKLNVEVNYGTLTIGDTTKKPTESFPLEFKVDIEKFDGTGNPKHHLNQYFIMAEIRGLTEVQVAKAFPLSLTGNAVTWLYSLDWKKSKAWVEFLNEFLEQFSYNTLLDVTRRDLEITRQKLNETFPEFVARWREKAAKMINRPNEKDQVSMIIKNLAPVYYNRMFSSPIMNFEQLYECGINIEDAINKGELDRNEGKLQANKMCSWFNAINNGPRGLGDVFSNACAIVPQCQKKEFYDLHMPLSMAFEVLSKKGYLKPLDSIPLSWNPNEYCAFHQRVGHKTDNCTRLRLEIQELIDQNVIPQPLPP